MSDTEYDIADHDIAKTTLPGGVFISTVRLFGNLGYETMVFLREGRWGELDCVRYSTEEKAHLGHEEVVTKWTGWTEGDPYPE